MQEVKKLKIRLDGAFDDISKAKGRVKRCEQENGAVISKEEVLNKRAMKAEAEWKERKDE